MATGEHQVDGDILQNVILNVGTGVAAGTPVCVGNLVGVTLDAADSSGNATVDITRKRWKFNVANVKTYNASTGAEATWAAIAQGDFVYIDTSFNLTTSPLDASGNANVIFGTVTDGSLTGTATQYTEPNVEILVGDD